MTRCGTCYRVGLTMRGKSDRRIVVVRTNIVACDNLRLCWGRPTINTIDSADHFAYRNVL